MRRFFAALTLASVMTAVAAPLWACPAIKGEDVNDEYVQAFIKAARKVGAPCPATFNDDGVTALIQYLPDGEEVESWKTMMAANIIYLGDKKPADEMRGLADKFLARIKEKDGTAEIAATHPHEFGTMYLVRYEVGAGDKKENSVVVIRPVGPDKAALIHWEKREGSISDEDAKMFGGINGFDEKKEAEAMPAPEKEDVKETVKDDAKEAPPAAVKDEAPVQNISPDSSND